MLKYPFTHLMLSHICEEPTMLATNINSAWHYSSFVAHFIFTVTFQGRYCYSHYASKHQTASNEAESDTVQPKKQKKELSGIS